MDDLLIEIRNCQVCKDSLPNPPKPIIRANENSRILIIGQAPGQKVQNSGIPWDDLSGRELRRWLGVSPVEFYNPEIFALIPMGFCFPGTGKSGDLPPRPECAPLWQPKLMKAFKNPSLLILIGQYAHRYYLKERSGKTLTDNVRQYHTFLPEFLPLVHPSPRNKIWQKKNPWFETELVPEVQKIVRGLLDSYQHDLPKYP